MQPCWHGGICEKCAQQLYLCPTYFEVILKARIPPIQATTPIQVLHLKPLGLVQSFNSAIVLKVQFHQKKLFRSKKLLTTTIDIDMMVDSYKLQDWGNVSQPNLW